MKYLIIALLVSGCGVEHLPWSPKREHGETRTQYCERYCQLTYGTHSMLYPAIANSCWGCNCK